MNQRIKIVWTLSVVTVVAVFCGQAYWLYNQLLMNLDRNAEELKTVCTKALDEDVEIRYAKYNAIRAKREKGLTSQIKTVMKDVYDSTETKKGAMKKSRKAETTVTFITGDKNRNVTLKGFDVDDAMKLSTRYGAEQAQRFGRELLDSILRSKGYGGIENLRFYKTHSCMIQPQYKESGTVRRTLHVDYSVNPIEYEAVRFTVAVPVGSAVQSMFRQLVGSVLMTAVLCLCMTYLLRTIIIQKRIDRIRHEFIKNMMYEQKPAPTVEPAPADAVRIGRTDFYYSANELRNGRSRVIITSRQAEILRLLADRINEVVSREELLNEVWGDDSYSNSNALNVQITYLRRALKSDPTVTIEAVIRKGYSLRLAGGQPKGD